MNANLKIIVDYRLKHPFGVPRRLEFFAHKANAKLVISPYGKHHVKYIVVKG